MRKKIYLVLTERLQQLIIQDGEIVFVTKEKLQEMKEKGEIIDYAIKHFDLWNDNVDFLGMEQPAVFPLCFFEFLPIKWEQIGNRVQMGSVTVLLHIVDRLLYPTHSNSEFKSKGLEYLDLLDKINFALSGFSEEGIGTISHTKSNTNHNHEEVIESIEEFTFEAKDDTCVKTLTKISVKPSLK
jgi:hypothetical protein